jgi:hypothetical protein
MIELQVFQVQTTSIYFPQPIKQSTPHMYILTHQIQKTTRNNHWYTQ